MARRRALLLLLAAACVPIAAFVYVAAVHIGPLRRADLQVSAGFIRLGGPHTSGVAVGFVHLVDLGGFAVLAIAVIVLALVRGHRAQAIAAAVAIAGANVTTQILKPLLAAHRPGFEGSEIGSLAWPSGHTTAVASLALALVIASPPRRRPLAAAAGGLLVVAVAYSLVLLGWHYATDVLGGVMIAFAWACAAAAALLARRPPGPPLAPRAAFGPLALAAAIAVASAAFAVARIDSPVEYVRAHTQFAVGAAIIAAAAIAATAAISLALTRVGAEPPARSASDRRTPRARRARS